MENDILDSLNDLCYDGPLSDEVALSKALDSGPKSLEYAKLVHILADELKKLCNVEETVNLMNDPDEWSSFILELSSFLKELKCPYKNLTTGHMSSRLQTKEDRILLLDYLISELMAARMVNIDCPKEKNSSGMEIIVQESPVAKDLKEILIALKFNKPPPNITPEMLFSKLEAKLKETIQKEGDQLVGKPLYNKSISEKDWKQLENSFTEMFEEYRLRRETLITRLECTIQSFEWSERLKTKKDSIQSTFRPKREQMKVKPNVKLSDFLAARSALLQVEKTSSASVRKNTQSDVNKVIIGQVPDRGGRPNEQQPPPPEMPSWQQRSAPQVILAQCLKVHQDQVMSSQQCVRPPKRSLPDEEPTRTPKSLKITDNTSAISPKAGPSVALNEPTIWPQIGATNANQVIKEVGPCLVGSVPPNARKTGPQMESPNANQVSKKVGPSPGGSLAPNVLKTGPQTNPSQGTKEMGACPIGVVAPNAPETGPQMGLVNANQVPKEIAPDMKATNANSFFYRDVLCRVGISNKIPMTNEQLELVRRSILKAIEVSERGTGPQFRGCLLKQGWLLITCEDMRSREWLVRQVGILKPFPGAELSIMAPEQMPKTIIAHVCAPKSEAKTVDQVIKMLRVQNKGLNTQTWKVFNCNDLESALDITVSIDKESAEVLRSVKCKASLGFKQVTFRFKDDKKPSTQPMEQASTSNQPPQSADSPTYIKGN